MTLNFKNGEEYYYKIFQIFNLSVALTLLPFGYLVLEKHAGHLDTISMNSWLLWVIVIPTLVVITALIIWGRKKHNIGKNESQEMPSLREKLTKYYFVLRYTYLIYWLVCSLSIVLLWATGSGIYIISYVVIMVLLSLNRPTLNLIIEDLKLNDSEEKCLVNKEDIPN